MAGLGTGGTVSGVARYLKGQDRSVRVVAGDVGGLVFTEYFRTGRLVRPRPYLLEGLGYEEIIGCPELELIDEMVQVSDRDAFGCPRELARSEAIFAGGSSGAALWGVREVLARLPREGRREGLLRVATILPDSGYRYLSRVYNDGWMKARGLL